ncbi:MAG: cache domain-containing protein [Deltaproteobacteria bacterium]|nr:cache domain-containing protein [Deltaproteobacteria bacterium]
MKKSEKSIRKFLILSLGLLSISPLILLSTLLSWDHYLSHKIHIAKIQRLMSNVALQKINNYLDQQRVLLLSTIKATNIIKLNQYEKENILSMLLSSTINKEYGKVFQDLILLDEKGFEEVHVSRTEIFIQSDLIDLSGNPGYQAIMAGAEIHYEPVYFEKGTGEPLLIVSLPLKDVRLRQIKGVLIAHIRMRYMWDVIAKIEIGDTGITYILNSENRVIAHPDPSIVLKETYFNIDNKKTISSGLDGSRVAIAQVKMMLGDEKYFIVTEVPVKEALSYMRQSLLITVIFSVITLFAAIMLIVLLLKKMVKPIETLAHTAQAISKGDFDQKANVSGNDELAYLAGSFNFMTSTLLENIESLEANIEERKEVEKKLVLSLKEKEVLLREVHHRVKNNMQIINSLLNMQIKKMDNKGDIEMVKASQMRIRSMSLIHEKLYKSERLALIDINNYISDLIALLINTYKGLSYNVNFNVDIKETFLDLDLAISCGFIINELITNSLKYGFPDEMKGNIYIKISKKEGDLIEMLVKDDGIGMSPDYDIRNSDSIGLCLVTMLSELQLGGKIELCSEEGTEFRITFKDKRKSQGDI